MAGAMWMQTIITHMVTQANKNHIIFSHSSLAMSLHFTVLKLRHVNTARQHQSLASYRNYTQLLPEKPLVPVTDKCDAMLGYWSLTIIHSSNPVFSQDLERNKSIRSLHWPVRILEIFSLTTSFFRGNVFKTRCLSCSYKRFVFKTHPLCLSKLYCPCKWVFMCTNLGTKLSCLIRSIHHHNDDTSTPTQILSHKKPWKQPHKSTKWI